MIQQITDKMLATMGQQEIKDAQLVIKLNLKDGGRRSGVYQDLVVNPLNHEGFIDVPFVKMKVFRPEKGLIVYVPITNVDTVEWSSLEAGDSDE